MKVLKLIQVNSQSDPTKQYVVRRIQEEDLTEYWVCSCPAFLFRNPEHKPCKHIDNYLKELEQDSTNSQGDKSWSGKLKKIK